ncbi:MAG: hypothetical protein BWY99_01436 [Synergistetes bacterium ADurb.BinA166]|nr:MAG: hypothetical protein BWY99_01436 [Synergistetes bacterium ADurb.BinA166]
MTIVSPVSLLSCTRWSRMSLLAPMSIPLVGSETKSRLGSRVMARAMQTFCWLPPESRLASWRGPVHRMSSFSIISRAYPVISLEFRMLTLPVFMNIPFVCIAVATMLNSIDSSSRSPVPLLSSDTNAMRLSSEVRGEFSLTGSPFILTSPLDGKSPIMPLAMPILPCPASPAIPSISPRLTSRSTPFTASPGMATDRPFISRTGSSLSSARGLP